MINIVELFRVKMKYDWESLKYKELCNNINSRLTATYNKKKTKSNKKTK